MPEHAVSSSFAELLVRLQKGDEGALEELFGTTSPVLARFAFKFPVPSAVVEDVLAQVFTRVWERRRFCQWTASFS